MMIGIRMRMGMCLVAIVPGRGRNHAVEVEARAQQSDCGVDDLDAWGRAEAAKEALARLLVEVPSMVGGVGSMGRLHDLGR